MSSLSNYISKTAFIKFEQCAKAFYLYKKHYYLRDKPTKEKELIFARGHSVGELAHQLFPGGRDVSSETNNTAEALLLTRELLQNKADVIYEAAFIHEKILVYVDLLVKNGDNYSAYEVKSSLKINETYIKDACLQYYVVKKALPLLTDFFLVNLNPDYVLEGELDVKKLFRKRSVCADAEKNFPFFDHRVSQMLLTLEKDAIPGVPIGKHCFSPYQCEFLSTCWKNTDDPKSIFNLGKIGRDQLFEWYDNGRQTVDKIVANDSLKPWINIQIKSISENKEHFEKEKIKNFLGKVQTPYCFMDMEIWSPAIPAYQGTRPFEQIPFLFSMCYTKNDKLVFNTYLKQIDVDGREEFLQEILAKTNEFKSVLVYDKNLEVQVLNALKNKFPSYRKDVDELIEKMLDLSEPVLNFHYYHPVFKGSFSLKAVADIIEDYTMRPEISSGIIAMYTYESLLSETNPLIAESTKQQLIDYCNSDTEICLRFFNFLKEKVME